MDGLETWPSPRQPRVKAPATSILGRMWDNHHGDGAFRTPPLYLHAGRQSCAPLWLQMENWSIITQKKWKLGAAPPAARSKQRYESFTGAVVWHNYLGAVLAAKCY